MRKIKILTYVPNPMDTTSLYRGWGPLGHLERNHPDKFDFVSITSTKLEWPHFQSCDWFFCQRPKTQDMLENIERAKTLGVKVWLDYDDDYFSITPDNKTFVAFSDNSKQYLGNTVISCKMADVVTVSTPAIAAQLSKYSKEPLHKFVVIPNAIDTRWWAPTWKKVERKEADIISWRGGDSHLYDTNSVTHDLLKFMQDKPETKLHVHGFYVFEWLQRIPADRQKFSSLEIPFYHRSLFASGGKVGIVPLVENDFNKAKSNIGALELLCAGHAVVAADLPEFQIPGVLNYKNTPDDFYNKLESAFSNWKMLHRDGLAYVLENCTLDTVNQKRVEILCES